MGFVIALGVASAIAIILKYYTTSKTIDRYVDDE